MLYVVLDDDETWSTMGSIIPDEVLTDEQRKLVFESDSKVFTDPTIPRVSISRMVRVLKIAGMWDEILNDAQAEGKKANADES